MALAAYARNVFGPQRFVDVNLVTIVIGASGRIADRSSPETTVGAGASGAYVCTMPSGVGQISVGQECINSGAAGVDKLSIHTLSSANGVTTFTVLKSDGVNFAGVEEGHITFLVLNQ